MAKASANAEWMAAQGRLKEAERAAGISDALHALNERNAFITSAYKHAEDYRNIVFSVPDLEARRRVIQSSRECHRLCRATAEEEIRELQTRVRDGGEKIRRSRLWGAVVVGVVGVWAGDAALGVVGAVGAAVIAILIGVDHILRADRQALADVEYAKSEIEQQNEFLRDLGLDGNFSQSEEAMGERDPAWRPQRHG